jgi:hypothetical protein
LAGDELAQQPDVLDVRRPVRPASRKSKSLGEHGLLVTVASVRGGGLLAIPNDVEILDHGEGLRGIGE